MEAVAIQCPFTSVRYPRQNSAGFGALGSDSKPYTESEIKKFVEQPSEDYQIGVAGPVLDAFNSLSLADFKPKTFSL